MDWNDEDTEVLQIANRVRQMICKNIPESYLRLVSGEQTSGLAPLKSVTVKLEGFFFILFRAGDLRIDDVRDGSARTIFHIWPLQAKSRPRVKWNKHLVREHVVPLLDREMILDDLSLL